MSVQLDAAFNYNDLQGLDVLKQGARNDDPKALKAVAQQFESMFIGMILSSMREATDVMASDLENSHQTRFYRQMHDQQLSLSLSQTGGFGLADVLYEQMLGSQNPQRPDLLNMNIDPLSESTQPNPLSRLPQPAVEAQSLNTPTQTVDAIPVTAATESPIDFSTPKAFIESLMPFAKDAAKQLGVEPQVLIAQAALETGWGQHVIQHAEGQSSNNLFGIKANQGWGGDTAQTLTHEFIEGRRMTIKDTFRSYESVADSFKDYVAFISTSPRYQPALMAAQNGDDYATALQQSGYATDPNYADKIIRIARSEWFEKG